MARKTKKELDESLRMVKTALKEAVKDRREAEKRYLKRLADKEAELEQMTRTLSVQLTERALMERTIERAAGAEYGFKEAIKVLGELIHKSVRIDWEARQHATKED